MRMRSRGSDAVCGGVAHIEEADLVEGGHAREPGRRALQGAQPAVRPIHLDGAALRIVDGHPIGHRLQDGLQAVGAVGAVGRLRSLTTTGTAPHPLCRRAARPAA